MHADDVRVSLAAPSADGPDPVVLGGRDGDRTVDGAPLGVALERLDGERAILRERAGGAAHRLLILPVEPASAAVPPGVTRREVVIDGWRVEVDVESAARAALRERARRGRAELGRSGPTKVHAIIPGVVVAVSVAAGDAVAAGQQLLVVEAMKMQNELRAPREGTIEQVAVAPGATIEVGDLLLVIA
jgi:biotin carboxyl carrier protein